MVASVTYTAILQNKQHGFIKHDYVSLF